MGSIQGTAEFCGFLENTRQRERCGIRLIFGRNIERWIGFLGLNREIDGEDFSNLLQVEETIVFPHHLAHISFPNAIRSDYQDELWLRRVCNVYVAQVVLKHFTIEEVKKMSHDERMEKLFPLVRERLLVLPSSRICNCR